jgi:hypothetical protein
MQAARADNFYHPPEWDPQKESLDKVSSLYLQFRYRPGLHGHNAKSTEALTAGCLSTRSSLQLRQRTVVHLCVLSITWLCSIMGHIVLETVPGKLVKAFSSSGVTSWPSGPYAVCVVLVLPVFRTTDGAQQFVW